MRFGITFTVLIGLIASMPGWAGEIYRLQADIDGDGRRETIQVLTLPAMQSWRSQAIVKVGGATYSTEFFSAESGVPDIELLSIDNKRAERQLLLETPEAGSCIYHLLSYIERRLVLLLRFESGPSCKAPRALGNGDVSVSTWQGFWWKEDTYRLSLDGTVLVKEEKSTYYVGVAGAAGKQFLLQGAECAASWVQPGAYLRVKLYDPNSDRYRLDTLGGGCGWVSSADLSALDPLVRELPWAG